MPSEGLVFACLPRRPFRKGVEQQTTTEDENIFFSLLEASTMVMQSRIRIGNGKTMEFFIYLSSFVCKLEKYLHGEDGEGECKGGTLIESLNGYPGNLLQINVIYCVPGRKSYQIGGSPERSARGKMQTARGSIYSEDRNIEVDLIPFALATHNVGRPLHNFE